MAKMSTIDDELDELTFLNDVNIFISEYIPFGSNHIIAFNEELDSQGTIEGGMLTSLIDEEPQKSTFFVEEDLTKVLVTKFDPNDFIQFQASISFENVSGVEQEEDFAVHVDASGRVIYGCFLEKMEDKTKEHSIDKLSRVVADLVADSSEMMINLLSTYQRRLLELVFFDRPLQRNKFIMITATSIKPEEPAEFYVKNSEYRNELNQIINQVYGHKELSDGGKCFFGSEGLIIISKEPDKYEELLSIIGFFQGLDIFQKNYFSKMFMLWDEVKAARKKIDASGFDPNAIGEAQTILSSVSSGVVLMNELLEFMETAVSSMVTEYGKITPLSPAQKEVAEFIDLQDTLDKAKIRIDDARLIVAGLKDEIQGVTGLVATLSERQMRQVNESLKDSIASMDEMTRSSERTGVALNILEVVLTGAIAIDIILLFSGDFEGPIFNFVDNNKLLFVFIVLTAFVITGYGILKLMNYLEERAAPSLRTTIKLGLKYNAENLKKYLASIEVTQQQLVLRKGVKFHEYQWDAEDTDKWKGNEPTISMNVDQINNILLSMVVNIDSPKKITTHEVSTIILNELIEAGIIDQSDVEI